MAEISEPRKLSLVEMKARAQAKTEHDKENSRIKRDILVLTLEFLRNNGYIDSCQRLQSESGVSLAKWQGADNMDLRLIVSEFESFFKIKYGKQPKLTRKSDIDDEPPRAGGGGVKMSRPQSMYGAEASPTANQASVPTTNALAGNAAYTNASANNAKYGRRASGATTPKPGNLVSKPRNPENSKNPDELSLGVIGHSSANETPITSTGIRGGRVSAAQLNSIHGVPMNAIEDGTHIDHYNRGSSQNAGAGAGMGVGGGDGEDGEGGDQYEHRLLKPMPHYTGQLRELADVISQDIYTNNPNCRWDDIVGLGEAKQLVQEAVIMPIKYPQIFTGLLSPWKGILLYGPPGTGKTMLARAVATECNTTFFNISASSIVSKFRGDSEKLVRVLFDMARFHAPSTIFLDEIDSIMGNRDAAGEHEASRRMKTELLVQMDGLAKSNDLVFVLAASNHPWHLDIALLRRLEKRILVPLPDVEARYRILTNHLYENKRSNADTDTVRQIAVQAEGYSGADLVLLCKEAAMRPVRRLMVQVREAERMRRTQIEAHARAVWEQQEKEERERERKTRKGAPVPKRVLSDPEEIVRKMLAEAPEPEVQLDPVTREDVLAAMKCTRPVTDHIFLQKYHKWAELHGNGYSDDADLGAGEAALGIGAVEE